MRTVLLILAGSFAGLILSAQTNTELSLRLIGKMQRAQYDSCQTMFDTVVSNRINADMMKQIWESMPNYIGEYQSYGEIHTLKTDSSETVTVRCNFAKTKLDLQLAFNAQQKIIGIFFLPPKNTQSYTLPGYAEPSRYYESKVELKSGKYLLPGILSMPSHVKYPPVVILLAGSGPNDKDETIGPNKPLKDLAAGLASKGIASYRFDKRTLTYGREIAAAGNYTLNDEVIQDAVNAVAMIRKHPLTKGSKIYIVGHSLGAMCAPLVASKSGADGLVLLAGNARPLEDLLVEQYRYLLGDKSPEAAHIEQQVALVKDAKALKAAKPEQLPLGLATSYWQSLRNYNQLQTAKTLKQPVLILQGERDYQVTMKDFGLWKSAMPVDAKHRYISYPDLNHLFMKGEGKSLPAEYEQQGNVDEQVITDISSWIKSH